MMNHLLRIVLVLALPIVVVLIIVLSDNRPGSLTSMETRVGEFVYAFLDHDVEVEQYVRARLPQNFRAEMSAASYGDTPYYVTTHRANPKYPGLKPLPYPPNDLWCVKLKSSNPTLPQVVVLALHQDIYNADWVMHQVIDPEMVLAAVGCQLANQ